VKIGIVVQGLFEKSDSIGYDAIFQYHITKALGHAVFLYAETFDASLHPGIPIHGMEQFYLDFPDGLDKVFYHFCDGWDAFDAFVLEHKAKMVVRWHNNTPPWFYMFKQKRFAMRSLRGFEVITSFAAQGVAMTTNSAFTSEQLSVLGGKPRNATVVFPGSRYLISPPARTDRDEVHPDNVFNVLFVGRFVAHKGHRAMIHVCNFMAEHTEYKVNLNIVGREDRALNEYYKEIENIQKTCSVNVFGEVSEQELYKLYDTTDAFLFLSEHEGFGLPIFEAISRNLPVVAWRNSALDSLLVDHPMAFKEFDVIKFASALIALKERRTRETVLKIQNDIAKQYSFETVQDQLSNFLKGCNTAPKRPVASHAQSYLDVQEQVDIIYRSLADIDVDTSFLHDFSGHYVSKYDLRTFRIFLDEAKSGSTSSPDNLSSDALRYIDLSFEYFSSHHGAMNDAHMVVPEGTRHDNHIIFGPYIDIPKGEYELELFFNTVSGNNRQPLKIEIASETLGILGRSKTAIGASFPINFTVREDDKNLEIRISTSHPITKDILFEKARLKKKPRRAFSFLARLVGQRR